MAAVDVPSLRVWEFGRLGVWGLGRLGGWEFGNLGIWEFGRLAFLLLSNQRLAVCGILRAVCLRDVWVVRWGFASL